MVLHVEIHKKLTNSGVIILNYFKNLYTPDEDESFDDNVKLQVENELHEIKQHLQVIKCSKGGKACGEDRVYYENFIYGGPIVPDILRKLFSAMLKFSHTPTAMKRGIIITLYKGGKRKKSDPNSYRAITLLSVVLKLYEKVLLSLFKDDNTCEINALQSGFQPNMGCMITSFMVRESIHFAKEQGSKLFMCFLDIRQAFDRAWQDLLMLKLYLKGVNISLLKAVINLYEDMYSCVRTQGFTSDWFPVNKVQEKVVV